jgi:endonuclease/exonuclease/phosphatase family metal-dependent hydrolase
MARAFRTFHRTLIHDSINEAGLLQMITSHTRCQNMIDLLFVNDEQIINSIEIVDDSSTCVKSDHRAITFNVHIRMKTKQKTKRTVYNSVQDRF